MHPAAEKKQTALAVARAGDFNKAKALFMDVVQSTPNDAEAWFLLAAVNNELNLSDEAITAYRRTIALHPANVDAHVNLGTLLEGAGLLEDATEEYKQAIACDANCVAAHYNYGNILLRQGELETAIQSLQTATRLQPGNEQIELKLASAFKSAARFREALTVLQQLVTSNPDCALAYNLKGNILQAQGHLTEAIASYRDALQHKPDFASAYCNTGSALLAQGCATEARDNYANAIRLDPAWAGAHSNLLLTENYHSTDALHTFELHRDWDKKYCPTDNTYTHDVNNTTSDRLKIGYLSPDFRTHSVAYFMLPILSHHNNAAVEIYCYSDVASPDATTAHIKSLDLNWRNVYSLSDKLVADLIYEDGIDILVDLAGHTANNRLPVFGMKPAPIQITYLGYPNTTGMRAMDYRLTDEYADPTPDTDALYTEKLLRLPHGFLCYAPPAETPPVGEPPCEKTGQVCFGSFNNMAKVTPETIELWSSILNEVPGATLVLKNSALADEGVRNRCFDLFASHGIDARRIQLLGQTHSLAEHLGLYQHIDIALDTFPYNGTTTTCEALWMGVPVITLEGTLHAGRVGTSILKRLGLPELIAADTRSYCRIAATLAADRPRLGQLRASMRNTLKNSSLCNAPDFTRALENIYREVWNPQ